MPWAWLGAAGVLEVVWVATLKLSEGFTRVGWALATVGAAGGSFLCMSQALRTLQMGTVYAVWTGIGTVGALCWGIAIEGEPASLPRLGCVCLIPMGVVGLKLGS